ncbi:unnamed protein product [Symbiodinium natans]|uniref:Uncharacterized protein n=1 Tax=Symbiodinium natans TaxID=878477 RepID=A0A812T6A1_9DINO|nr:unnamed protein product [Symbiodinium natans]
MAELTSEEIIGRLKACVHDEPRLIHFAQSLGQEHLADKRDAAHQLMAKVEPLAHQIWGPQVQLVLHGSRAKGTFTDDSDFDYHIEKTGRPVTMDEMYKLKSLCNRLPGVSTIPRIKMALSISYKVEALQEGSIYVEIAPESADYIDDAATIEPLIQRAGTYFLENTSACLTVKLLKFLFQRTQPRLKACAIEQLVQEMHSKVVYKYLAGRDCGPQALLLLCCKQILEDEHQEFAAMKGTVGKIFPQGLPRIHLPSRVGLMQTRRDPELMLREVSPLTCSPERAWREMSPPTHGYSQEVDLRPRPQAGDQSQQPVVSSTLRQRGRSQERRQSTGAAALSLTTTDTFADQILAAATSRLTEPKFWTSGVVRPRLSFD